MHTDPNEEQVTDEAAADLEAELSAVRAELAEVEDRLKRTQADFANYRRRMMTEQARWEDRGVGRLAAELLPVADNLERALKAFDQAQSAQAGAFRQGIELTLRQLHEVLERYEIRPIEAAGRPFDPRVHEAVGQVETAEVPEDHVVAELQRGYTFRSEVLRPALVQVARRPAPQDAEEFVDDEEGNGHGQGRGH